VVKVVEVVEVVGSTPDVWPGKSPPEAGPVHMIKLTEWQVRRAGLTATRILAGFEPLTTARPMLQFKLTEYNHMAGKFFRTVDQPVMPRHRVLLVEDDPDTLQLLRLELRDMPLDIEQACSGTEAIAAIDRAVPELIFLDINLPDMRGWEVLDRFKADARLQTARIIVLTSHNDPVHRLIGSLQPITAYLSKPVAANELRQYVRDALRLP
jgi:CheY-like chemotaxis protein